jgi:UDP-N-acetylglucosamine 2-epimerase (non-hydrolysing)/GDP/UDP-N,N'-diacetylbacillosamine 2-epimerase (hydrolysing)
MNKRKIVSVTGSRAEYGLASNVFRAIKNHPKLELSLIVTGMHLSDDFGYTIKEIEKDDFEIAAKLKILIAEDTNVAMAKSIGKCILQLVDVLEKIKPDILLVLTDLSHSLAAAVVGTYMNISIAHIHGGDVSGHVDEPVRHAITKLSHIHFPATKKSAERILKMGEEPWRVLTVGTPSLDTILKQSFSTKKEVIEKFSLDTNQPLILVVQHPVTMDTKNAAEQMKETMEALKELNYQAIVIYPNADVGGRRMIKIINQYKKYPKIQTYKSLPYKDYLGVMNVANVMVGNSSSGIIEAPSFHLPFVNIGSRQKDRERSENVIDVNYDKEEIKEAIDKTFNDKRFIEKVKKCKNPYGDGKTGERIADILSKIKINSRLLEKRLTY